MKNQSKACDERAQDLFCQMQYQSKPTTEENMLTLIQYIQLPEQERLSMMKGNVVQSNATDHNMKHRLDSKLMSFKQYAQDWLQIITKYADYQLNKDALAADSKAAASSLNSESIQDQRHQSTGENHV